MAVEPLSLSLSLKMTDRAIGPSPQEGHGGVFSGWKTVEINAIGGYIYAGGVVVAMSGELSSRICAITHSDS